MIKILTILLLLISLNCLAQKTSDLYLHIDSLIKYELQYEYDSTTDQLPVYEWDSTKTRIPNFSTFPTNPSPLMLLNGKRISKKDLNEYKLSQIATIDVYQPEDKIMRALYGSSTVNGAIFIQTKKFQRKSRKREQ